MATKLGRVLLLGEHLEHKYRSHDQLLVNLFINKLQ